MTTRVSGRLTALALLALLTLLTQAAFGSACYMGRTITTAVSGRCYHVDSASAGHATEATHQMIASGAHTLTRLWVWASVAPGAGNSWTITVRNNASATSQVVVLTGGDTAATDIDDVEVAAGDLLAVLITGSGSPPATAIHWCIDYTPAVPNGQFFGAYSAALHVTTTEYYFVKGYVAPTNVPRLVIPTAGTLSNLRVKLSAAPGDAKTRTFTLQKNSVDTALLETITGAATTTGSDDGNSVAVVAGDLVRFSSAAGGTPAAAAGWIGVIFTPATANRWIVANSQAGVTLATEADNYLPPSGVGNPDATEANVQQYVRPIEFLNMYAYLSGSAGAGKSYTFTLRDDAADTLLSCTVSGSSAITANDTDTVAVALDSLIDTESTPAGTPTARYLSLSYTAQPPSAASSSNTHRLWWERRRQ